MTDSYKYNNVWKNTDDFKQSKPKLLLFTLILPNRHNPVPCSAVPVSPKPEQKWNKNGTRF